MRDRNILENSTSVLESENSVGHFEPDEIRRELNMLKAQVRLLILHAVGPVPFTVKAADALKESIE